MKPRASSPPNPNGSGQPLAPGRPGLMAIRSARPRLPSDFSPNVATGMIVACNAGPILPSADDVAVTKVQKLLAGTYQPVGPTTGGQRKCQEEKIRAEKALREIRAEARRTAAACQGLDSGAAAPRPLAPVGVRPPRGDRGERPVGRARPRTAASAASVCSTRTPSDASSQCRAALPRAGCGMICSARGPVRNMDGDSQSSCLSHATTPSWRSTSRPPCFVGALVDTSSGSRSGGRSCSGIGSCCGSRPGYSASICQPLEARWAAVGRGSGCPSLSEVRHLEEASTEVCLANAMLVDSFLNVKRKMEDWDHGSCVDGADPTSEYS